MALQRSTRPGLQTTLERLSESAALLGLEVGVDKCAALGIAVNKKKKTWAQDSTPFTISGRPIQALAPGEFYKYLSVQMSGTGSAMAYCAHEDLVQKHGKLKRAPAKPKQKLCCLQNIIIPREIFPLVNMNITASPLCPIDRTVKRFVRYCLHLPMGIHLSTSMQEQWMGDWASQSYPLGCQDARRISTNV